MRGRSVTQFDSALAACRSPITSAPEFDIERVAQFNTLPEFASTAIVTIVTDMATPESAAPTRTGHAVTSSPMTATAPTPARIDRYLVLGVLGHGGMGDVYLGFDARLERHVAIKVLKRSADSARLSDRLQREALALACLMHPNVVAVHEVGEAEGQVYLVMERVDGVTLRTWLSEQPRNLDEVLAVMRQAGSGLGAAHAAGLIHRDFKPKSRRPSQTAPQPTDRPHSHSQGRFERVDVDRAAPGRPGVPHVLAKRWQRAGPPEDQRGHGPRNTCWCVVGPLPIMTDAVQRFTSAVPRRKPCGQ